MSDTVCILAPYNSLHAQGLVHRISCDGEDGTVEELNELLRELLGT